MFKWDKVSLQFFVKEKLVYETTELDAYEAIVDLTFLSERLAVKLIVLWECGSQIIHSEEKNFYTASFAINSAHWITQLNNPIEKEFYYYSDHPTQIFEKKIQLKNPDKCFIDLVGLGYYILSVNNQRVGNFELNSDVTIYRKKVYYDTYEISKYLKKSENIITVECGNGWFNAAPIKMLGKYNARDRLSIGRPCLLANIESYDENGVLSARVSSDSTWQVKDGECLFNNIYIGEKRLFSEKKAEFESVVQIASPTKKLEPSFIPKIKTTDFYDNYQEIRRDKDQLIVDFQRIITGFFEIVIQASIHQKIHIRYAERMKDGKLDFKSTIPGIYGKNICSIDENKVVVQEDLIISEVDGEIEFCNQFSYHTFRYVEISGVSPKEIKKILGKSVHTEMKETGYFASSDEKMNTIWAIGNQTKLNNIHSYYEDCARERLGYGGDIVTLLDSQIYSFFSRDLLKKVWHDFILEQSDDGGVTQTAPYIGIKSNGASDRAGSLGWQRVLTAIPLALSKYYGENYFTSEEEQSIINFANYLFSFDYDFIKQCCLGDWGTIHMKMIYERETPVDREFCSAVMFYLNLKDAGKLLTLMNQSTLAEKLQQKAVSVSKAINEEFFHEETGFYGKGSQSSCAFALHAEIVPQEFLPIVEQNFIKKIIEEDCLTSGIFGMKWTYDILNKLKKNDLVFKWLQREDFPSFLDMARQGNHTLIEYFNFDQGSQNHAMFSSYNKWMLEKLVGLTLLDKRTFEFSPYLAHQIRRINGGFKNFIDVQIQQEAKGFSIVLNFNPNIELRINDKEIKQQGFSNIIVLSQTMRSIELRIE